MCDLAQLLPYKKNPEKKMESDDFFCAVFRKESKSPRIKNEPPSKKGECSHKKASDSNRSWLYSFKKS